MSEADIVLLVEDNEELNEINRRALKMRGYTVLAAKTLARARQLLAEKEPDVILLDVSLPDGDGFEFCGEIRKKTNAHILFLTARTEHEDKVRGLLTGGDDYISKPYHPEEMLARVEAVMRRRKMVEGTAAHSLSIGPLKLDMGMGRAFLSGADMLLTPKELGVLFLLARNKGKTLSKEEIYKEIWHAPMNDDAGTLWKHISRIKKKLEESGGAVRIVAVRGEGYRLEVGL